ncbi:hypothetical protein BEL04_06025 [Mucilaginibacter sp. PPCGB 2223]|uniref:SusC/RagA family TonB-linked outer membrane protein n=1 Tax=Mucilaginibacter sp. PPCGB 2223 TaxID=1886027 RepID=UPI0008246DA4|nr:SusC/RagA family TonB-linked outer membrane protein [Mucilaginibacter sp. PPCGB 2223]OCX53840.1 hypothetical protein BEL04_06025 [Mucilaginibacter sp. PPCGB 2223]
MKKNLLSLLFLSLFALSAFAQSRKITGTVIGADDGLALPGVSVKVQGTNVGTQTNAQGSYTLTVPQGAKALVFSYIGYTAKTVAIGNQSVINVKLSTDSKALTEVVVIGYGSGVQRKDAVGDIASVASKDLEDKPVANVLDALQGRVAGLSVLSSSGEPSSTPSINIHGLGSISSSNTPLIVMDGVPIDPGTLISLNPDDFESVTVLKDAASTSIYGSRASNGVLYITTKKGSVDKPASISVTSEYGISQIANTDYFNNFMNTAQFAAFEVATGVQTQAQVNATLATYNADTKWYKVYFKNNTGTYSNNFSVSGGSGKTTYFVSAGYFRQDGLAYRSLFNRYTFRANIATEVNKWMKFGVNMGGDYDERQTNPYGSNSLNRGLSVLAQPWYSPTGPDGNNYNFIPGLGLYHPQYLANNIQDNNNNIQFDPSAYLQITPIKGLTIKTQLGYDAFDFRESAVRLPSYIGSLNNGSDQEFFTRGVSKTFTNTAEYKFSVKSDNHFTALLGQEYTDQTNGAFNGITTGQTDDRLLLLSTGTLNKNASSSSSEYSYYSLFARADYDYKSRYFLEASIRNDKSSKFGINNQSATFYSVGATWKAKEENFLKNVSWLSDLTVRASTGTTGNSLFGNNYYQQLATVSTTPYNTGTGFVLAAAGDPDLTWEKQQMTDVGFSATFFNRIYLDASFYLRKTTAMLLQVPYAFTTGFASQVQNTGALQNKGVDIDLSFDLINRANAHKAYVTPHFIVNMNAQKITALFQGRNYWIPANTGTMWTIGQAITYIEPVWAGVNPTTGLPQWYLPDPNPDNVVNKTTNNGVTNTFNTTLQQNLGVPVTAWANGSFGLSAGYEGFSLDVLFNFVKGKYITNNDQYFSQNPTQFTGYNQEVTVLDYWKNPGDVTTFPKYGQQFTQFDSRLIQDASFMRLKNLTIGYSIPKSVLQRTKVIKGFTVFATGRDLLTFTKYKGIDPEVNSNIGLGNNPNTKNYSVGVKIGL